MTVIRFPKIKRPEPLGFFASVLMDVVYTQQAILEVQAQIQAEAWNAEYERMKRQTEMQNEEVERLSAEHKRQRRSSIHVVEFRHTPATPRP